MIHILHNGVGIHFRLFIYVYDNNIVNMWKLFKNKKNYFLYGSIYNRHSLYYNISNVNIV